MKVSFYEVDDGELLPYLRDEKTLARPWIRPGTPGAEHRIGGLEKQDGSGTVSYDPANHEHMIRIRAQKIAGIADDIVDAEVYGDTTGETLLVGWGGTYGALRAATMLLRTDGVNVSHMHIRHISPLPKNVEGMLRAFKRVIVAELNLGQLRLYLQSIYAIELEGYTKIQGQPFRVGELVACVSGTEEALQ
jgi:2-oxoglutarate ferredoxin oxidoreductase subunit alpha